MRHHIKEEDFKDFKPKTLMASSNGRRLFVEVDLLNYNLVTYMIEKNGKNLFETEIISEAIYHYNYDD